MKSDNQVEPQTSGRPQSSRGPKGQQLVCRNNALVTVIDYARQGWSVIPIPFRSKNPGFAGWEQLRLGESDICRRFSGSRHNIGVLLGGPSGDLIDVDLDHPLALEIASEHLPATGAIFGRASKRRSHWLYRSTRPITTRQWRLPDRKMLVELRSTGSQTVFPGSVHTSGEPIEWDADGEPASVDPSILVAALQAIVGDVHRRLGLQSAQQPTTVARGPAPPPSVLDSARRYLAKLPPAVSGQGGHDATFHAVCVLVIGFGLDREQSLLLMGEWNETCQPPWSTRELEHKVDDALKQPGWRGHLLSGTCRPGPVASSSAIARANRHAIQHRRRARRTIRT
jgi:hypothetical protein